MKKFLTHFSGWLIVFATLIISMIPDGAYSATGTTPEVTSARIGTSGGRTRFVLDVSHKIKYKIFTLANPYRVVIDIDEVDWHIGPGGAKGRGLIDQYRYGLFRAGTSRIVLDVKKPVKIHKSFTIRGKGKKPFRFVLDLKETTSAAFQKSIKKPVRVAALRPKPGTKTPRGLKKPRSKKLIVIDPGHGGHDPGNLGARGAGKFSEKTVTLSAAHTIRRMLEATGRYQVVMTRTRDIFLKLRDRSRMAHNRQADLFISIHADAFRSSKVNGATVYTLSENASDKEAAALAARENKSDIIAGVDLQDETNMVQNILIDLMKQETLNLSNRFANELIPVLKKAIRVRKRSHRQAGFAVLKGLDVPSVLIEMGYLTNQQDARLLMQRETQQKIGRAIVLAADRFFQKQQASY